MFVDLFLTQGELDDIRWDYIPPPQLPVTILDLERAQGCFDMRLHLADPCPSCGAFNMHVGDWVCCGVCPNCATDQGDLES